jgi:hypothetical protein
VHRVHIDESWMGFVVGSLCHVSKLVLVNWYFDVYFRASSLSD